MPSEVNELGLWNIVLDHLVEHPLASTSEDSTYARWLERNVPNLRDAFLRRYTWNFSIQYNTLTADATDPDFRWKYRYECPTDWLRVLPPTAYGTRGGSPVPYEVVGDFIHTDQYGPLYVRTIQRIEDYTEWDPMALDLLALSIAVRATMRFAAKATYRDRLMAEAADLSSVAFAIDAMEGSPDPVEQHQVIDARLL